MKKQIKDCLLRIALYNSDDGLFGSFFHFAISMLVILVLVLLNKNLTVFQFVGLFTIIRIVVDLLLEQVKKHN